MKKKTTTTYNVDLGQAHKCGGIKPIYEVPTDVSMENVPHNINNYRYNRYLGSL
jgi:hypothetical protein